MAMGNMLVINVLSSNLSTKADVVSLMLSAHRYVGQEAQMAQPDHVGLVVQLGRAGFRWQGM